MSPSAAHAQAMLDAWRQCHADRLDPVRFRFIEAMATRAAGHDGEVRRILDTKLSALLDAYARDLETAAGRVQDADAQPASDAPPRGALGELVDHIARCAPSQRGDSAAAGAAPQPAFAEMELLDEFRKLWSRLRAGSQLRQSLERTPANAGPLNSAALVHRALALMHESSPGYLQHFLAYVDALSGVESVARLSASVAKDVPPAVGAKKRARRGRGRTPGSGESARS